MRFAKELLGKVIFYCRESNAEDWGTLTNILKMKIKGMHGNLHAESVAQLLKNNPDYPAIGT